MKYKYIYMFISTEPNLNQNAKTKMNEKYLIALFIYFFSNKQKDIMKIINNNQIYLYIFFLIQKNNKIFAISIS